ncbi:DUF1802 family protein [Trichormus variabilis]|uniref:DUF1802 domain-containing protein n=1 Tax=Trichormus variabilis NIES-23 TaxID=1973479 RepID=A0A1Z4KLR9_ANAVA|nr:DUF1802 family protein [Trichormus variabilis]MBD2350982.1 DUF1802 family protein [Trichormus variabilis FACHB-171]BAY69915.1 hypothetical protein NIES23_27150 [Trichormus variabilis NIES-23]
MNQLFSIPTALCLPAPEIEALIQGRTIAAMPKMFIRPGQKFLLYPADISIDTLSIEQYYRANLLSVARTNIQQHSSQTVFIKAWARCELCQVIDKTKPLNVLSQLTIWTPKAFEAIIQKQENIFLVYLRVYHLPQECKVTVDANIQEKFGKFVSLPNIAGSEDKPILKDSIFERRKQQLEKIEPPQHPELDELQSFLAPLAISNPGAKELDDDIQIFLGWKNTKQIQTLNTDLAWINDIAKLGDRSIELDEKKSNYQAGTDFENITRQSLEFLGFKVEYAYKGGAGGLDLFCSQPYPLVCECKAGKSIPDRAVEELDRIGKRHLKENYLQAVKLIIGPGQPTKNLKDSAEISKISIINVMTLQKLVELKVKYPGAINLIELRKYLKPGQIDYKINEYIDKVEQAIKLRSHIIQLVNNYLENSGTESAGVEALHGAYFASHPPQPLKTEEMHEILIELSSPLTGYLGRVKGNDWRSDRFYYLRDLTISSK